MVLGYICPCCGIQDEFLDEFSARKGASESTADDQDLVCQPCHADASSAKKELDFSVHTIPHETSVVGLKAAEAFGLLSAQEKSYAFYVGKASWEGAKICLLQCSPEAVPIFSLFQLVFGTCRAFGISVTDTVQLGVVKAAGNGNELSDDEVKASLMYIAAFYGNLGNYKSFGDTKFVPAVKPSKFKAFLAGCLASAERKPGGEQEFERLQTKFEPIWRACCVRMYSLLPRQRQLGLGKTKGVTTYFTPNCEEPDAEMCGRFLDHKGVSPYNTRLFKDLEASGKSDSAKSTYTVKVASAVKRTTTAETFESASFRFEYGDYAPLMARICANLEQAAPVAANDSQRKMLDEYIRSFREGSIEAHKDASRHWIKDTGPAVESYIGFIESYRDPSGSRGEWEGFCACVNKEVSKKFQKLVDGAPELLELMPWSVDFEKAEFQRPDFTSLEVLAFGSSGVPAGINIPNYDDIRQSEGFKNVSLGNVLQASYGACEKPVTFLSSEGPDQQLFKELKGPAFEVQVGCHELLGHGSGRLYHNGTKETEEFLSKKILDLDGKRVLDGPFYAVGSTWDSTFGKIASPYEECRAECCGIYLSLEPSVLQVFGHDEDSSGASGGIHDVTYVNWLLMVRAGLQGLEFYTPETGTWRQAHMNARYVILRVLLEAGDGLVELQTTTNAADGEPDIIIKLDRSRIMTVGKRAIGVFLQKLQIYKSLGDLEKGGSMFAHYSEVPEDMAALRKVVMARKEPRKLLIQPHMGFESEEGATTITYKDFAETPEGMIESFVARFAMEDDDLYALWEAEADAMGSQ